MQTWGKVVFAILLFLGIFSLLWLLPEGTHQVQVKSQVQTLPSGLQYIDKVVGKGAPVRAGQLLLIHYTGWLKKGKNPDGIPLLGKMFDSSRKKGRPLPVQYGPRARVIRGWIEGLRTMRVGGRRLLIIPARLGYGARGFGTLIPPHSDLVFDVEIVSAR